MVRSPKVPDAYTTCSILPTRISSAVVKYLASQSILSLGAKIPRGQDDSIESEKIWKGPFKATSPVFLTSNLARMAVPGALNVKG